MSQGPHVTVPCTAVNNRGFTQRLKLAGNLTSNMFAHWSSGGEAEDNTTS